MAKIMLFSTLAFFMVLTVSYAQQTAQNITFGGDFRLRQDFEQQENSSGNFDLRTRERLRMRLSANAKLSGNLEAFFRLASGEGSPVSTNQTFTGGFSGKSIYIDRAYIQWKPTGAEGLTVLGGKMKNPFITVGENEIIWDNDLNPEGAAFQYSIGKNGCAFFVNASYSPITERALGNDTFLLGGQGGFNCIAPRGKLTLGASYYDYRNMKHQLPVYISTKSYGNSLDKNGKYINDFNDLEVFGEYTFDKISMKPGFYADYVSNIAEDVEGKTAWITGIKLGEAQKPGSCAFHCSYRKEERNSVPGAFVDSAFMGGGTDGSGCEFNFDYQASQKTKISLTYYLNKKNLRDEKDYQRILLDFNFKI